MKAFMFIGLAALGAGVYVHFFRHGPSHALEGLDTSLSVTRDCEGIVAGAQRLTEGPGFLKGSTLTLLVIGKSASEARPERAFDKPLPAPPDTAFGADEAAFAARREEYFAEFKRACMAAPPRKYSPVFRLVSDGIAHLRSRGCGPKDRCAARFQTDLREDIDERLRAAISRLQSEPALSPPKEFLGAIDNQGIAVSFCGGAQSQGPPKTREASPEALSAFWKKLFTYPDLVSFEPFCGQ